MNHLDLINQELDSLSASFVALKANAEAIVEVATLCTKVLQVGGKVMFCGNGGSAADSQHLAAELVGRYKLNRPALNSIALTVDTSILTAVGNDYGYETIFERQVEGLGKAGDVLIGLSTSGNSPNVIRAFSKAKSMGIHTVALTGSGGGTMRELAGITLAAPSATTNHIQEMHITMGHLLCEIIEKNIFGAKE